jgi:hypothetical protein
MARRNQMRVPKTIADGSIARSIQTIWRSRLTSYQGLCLRLGELAIDLPNDRLDPSGPIPQRLHRHTDRYPSGYDLMPWILDVAKENLLAGMVLMDALAWYVEVLDFVVPSRMHRFPESREKREWTEGVGDYFVEFEVPEGWEFEFRHEVYVAGHRGVACVKRCHLSDNWYHSNCGYGRLVGSKSHGIERAIGFDIPCEYAPALHVDAETLQDDRTDDDYYYGVSLPHAFITRAFHRPWDRMQKLTFVVPPSNEEIIAIARDSVSRIQECARQWAASHKSSQILTK